MDFGQTTNSDPEPLTVRFCSFDMATNPQHQEHLNKAHPLFSPRCFYQLLRGSVQTDIEICHETSADS